MTIHPLPNAEHGPSEEEMEAVARARIAELSRSADDLLQQTTDVGPATAELLRAEATRLFAVAFEITRALCYDNARQAYRISIGEPGQSGDVLGLVG